MIVVAPATYNTICKWASGSSDTYALGILAETTGMGVPVIVLPYVNSARQPRPFRRSVDSLADEGVCILLGPGLVEPHQPRSGNNLASFPCTSPSARPSAYAIPETQAVRTDAPMNSRQLSEIVDH